MKYLAPNLLTAGNLVVGGFCLWLCTRGEFALACAWLWACVLFDGLDGLAARRLNAVSAFGRLFDSCADLVSFGAVPAFAFWLKHGSDQGWSAAVAFFYLLCAALRLVRFHHHNRCHWNLHPAAPPPYFIGLPTTASGGSYALLGLLVPSMPRALEATALLFLAGGMIGPWKVPRGFGAAKPAIASPT